MYDKSQAEFPEASHLGGGWALGEVQHRDFAGAGQAKGLSDPRLRTA